MVAFIVWVLCGMFLIGLGVHDYRAKAEVPFGFWANAETFPVNDVKGYNRALGKLFMAFGVIFILTGIPLLAGQNSPAVIISILGVMFEAIAVMVFYVVMIERKYRIRK